MRLTVKLRDTILTDLLAHAFGEQERELKKREHALAEIAYKMAYSEFERAALEKIGDKGFYTKGYIDVYIGEKRICSLCYDGAKFAFPKIRRLVLEKVDEPYQFQTMLNALVRDLSTLREMKKNARDEANGILHSVGTVKRLVEVWPEIAAFVPKTEQKSNLPALQMDKLNNLLGLPPETK